MDVLTPFRKPNFYAATTTLLFASAIFVGVLPVAIHGCR